MQPTMSNEYLIHRYLSEELSLEEEKYLFDALSESEELRSELSTQLRLQQETQKDLPKVSIPPTVTKAIFNSLGFTAPLHTGVKFSVAGRQLFTITTAKMSTVFSVAAILIALTTFAYMVIDRSERSDNTLSESTNKAIDLPVPSDSKSGGSFLTAEKPVATENRRHESASVKTGYLAENPTSFIAEHAKVIPNEPIKAYFDIGKFSSVDYLTQAKIIGVADAGKIYCSEDGGKSWTLQESKTSNDLFGVNFFDTERGVIVGANGTALVTPNAGRDWENVETKTKVNLITVRYATRDTIYACGAQGAILRSTTGGRDWSMLQSGTTASLFKIRFTNGSNGIVSGEHGVTFQTHDAGLTWEKK
jgi:hypothetical protein